MSAFALPKEYGYVFGVLGLSCFMNIYLAMNVSAARKKYDIQYPKLYATTEKDAEKFNCVQRAHQNTLESYAMVMLNMIVNGFVYPKYAAFFGLTWVIGRVFYGFGYSNYGPKGRMFGGILSHLGDVPLMIQSLKIAYDMITANN